MRNPLPSIIAVTASALVLATSVHAIPVTVNGASGPWDVSLNPGYTYGVNANGQDNFNLPPTVVDTLSGLSFLAGDSLTIASLTPGQPTLLAGANGTVYSDADGVPGWVSVAGNPAQYIGNALLLEELVGTFAYNGVIVGNPFAIGNGPTTVTIPDNVNQLLMGVNDGWYNDNGGSVTVDVSESSGSAVPDVSPTVWLLGASLIGLALLRGRRLTRTRLVKTA